MQYIRGRRGTFFITDSTSFFFSAFSRRAGGHVTRQEPERDVAHLPWHDIPARCLNPHGGRVHVRREQRRHPDLSHQGGDGGGASGMGHRAGAR